VLPTKPHTRNTDVHDLLQLRVEKKKTKATQWQYESVLERPRWSRDYTHNQLLRYHDHMIADKLLTFAECSLLNILSRQIK
jgi:hypothetical protein